MKMHENKGEVEVDEYLKFMAENFDMKCDYCETVFRGLHEAHDHYREYHIEVKKSGYIKWVQ